MKSKKLWRVFAAAIALMAALALVRTFAQERKAEHNREQKEQAQKEARAPRVTVEKGRTAIRLSAEEQSQAGIETESLKPARERRKLEVPAMVLDVQGLVNLASSYATAQANLRKAENNLAVSQPEYNRLKSLYTNQQNVSAKAFQAAEGAFQNDQSSVAAARQDGAYQVAALRQRWGNKIAQWVTGDPPILDRILNREDVLVQVTLPAGGPTTAPGELFLELPNHQRVAAQLVSRFPQVDPRIQGPSFLYVTEQQGALAPGLNLVAQVAVGPRLSGVIIPRSAVVWLNGDSWVYIQTKSAEFTRFAVSTDHPAASGFFVSKGLAPGGRVVSTGAQALLSQEFRSQTGGGEEAGEED
jgi:hypothetical protein